MSTQIHPAHTQQDRVRSLPHEPSVGGDDHGMMDMTELPDAHAATEELNQYKPVDHAFFQGRLLQANTAEWSIHYTCNTDTIDCLSDRLVTDC
jgi:hypothetical protein